MGTMAGCDASAETDVDSSGSPIGQSHETDSNQAGYLGKYMPINHRSIGVNMTKTHILRDHATHVSGP